MTIRNHELFVELLNLMLETRNISRIADRLHVDRTIIYRWLAASEANKIPSEYLVEFEGETKPLHEHARVMKKLCRVAAEYFDPEDDPSADFSERVQATGARDFTKRSQNNLRSRRQAIVTGNAEEVAALSDVEIVETLEHRISDAELFSDEPTTVEKLGPDPVPTGRERIKKSYAEVRQEEAKHVLVGEPRILPAPPAPAPEPEPSFEAEQARLRAAATKASQPLTERGKLARDARMKIQRRVDAGGSPGTPLELELIATLEEPSLTSRAVTLAKPMPPRMVSRGTRDDPPEMTGAGIPADGGMKMS